MKKILALLLAVVLAAGCMTACTNNPTPSNPSIPSTNPTTEPKPTEPKPTEPVDPWAEYEIITVADALTLCEQFVEAPSKDRYYIRGVIIEMQNEQYGQMVIQDETGSIMVYGSYNADGSIRYDKMTEKPVVGDEVLLYGTLQNYKGNTKEVQNARIIDFISNAEDLPAPELPAFDSTLTVAELLALPLADGELTEGRYYVRATVQSVTNPQFGAMIIADETGSISVYGAYSADGSVGYASMESKPVKGDEVLLYTNVKNFKNTLELNSAWIQEFTHPEFDESAYAAMSIADARKTENGTQVKVEGVVARITYANGFKPSGIILVDGTSSIYIYDGDLAGRVAIGNKVTVAASKTMWILESEAGNAEKFGYKGCNQLENAWLLSNDEGNHDFDKSWIETTTVKEILDTPVTEDITSIIFKVTAQIKEVPGNGFTNFYINDLDGKTGSYAYSQCNGGDFEWLRAFDGKICTVYVMALNAKATNSDCFWRFLPIAVVDEGFDPSTINVAEFAVKYHGLGQFQPSYTGNPALELLMNVDSELLNFTGAKLSYASSNTSVIAIEGGKLNCLKTGSADITVTGEYNGQTYSETVTISVVIADQSGDYATVQDAISAAVGEKVTVKGIVGPSLVNKTGFYLIDETGVIAVETTADVLATLKIGYEVVLEADRAINTKGGSGYCGQTCLKNATVVVNNYGEHAYSTASFKGDISVADFYALDITQDFTTSVFTMKATVVVEETAFYTNIFLSDGTTKVRLYCSNANQYRWLKEFAGQEVTVEIAACNWNDKTYYTGCVLSVINEDGTKTLNTLNFDN